MLRLKLMNKVYAQEFLCACCGKRKDGKSGLSIRVIERHADPNRLGGETKELLTDILVFVCDECLKTEKMRESIFPAGRAASDVVMGVA